MHLLSLPTVQSLCFRPSSGPEPQAPPTPPTTPAPLLPPQGTYSSVNQHCQKGLAPQTYRCAWICSPPLPAGCEEPIPAPGNPSLCALGPVLSRLPVEHFPQRFSVSSSLKKRLSFHPNSLPASHPLHPAAFTPSHPYFFHRWRAG